MDMNMNELYSLAQSIKTTEALADSKKFDDVIRYCVVKHNETRKILSDILDFLTDNLSVFNNGKGGWKFRNKLYYTEYGIGCNNPYNCVIMDYRQNGKQTDPDERHTIYWVDGGIYFFEKNGKVVYATNMGKPYSHGYGSDAEMWNTSRDNLSFVYFQSCYGRTTREKFLGDEWKTVAIKDEFSAKKIKDNVDKDYAHAVEVFKALGYSLKKIKESTDNRLNGIDSVKDGSANPNGGISLVIQL